MVQSIWIAKREHEFVPTMLPPGKAQGKHKVHSIAHSLRLEHATWMSVKNNFDIRTLENVSRVFMRVVMILNFVTFVVYCEEGVFEIGDLSEHVIK